MIKYSEGEIVIDFYIVFKTTGELQNFSLMHRIQTHWKKIDSYLLQCKTSWFHENLGLLVKYKVIFEIYYFGYLNGPKTIEKNYETNLEIIKLLLIVFRGLKS